VSCRRIRLHGSGFARRNDDFEVVVERKPRAVGVPGEGTLDGKRAAWELRTPAIHYAQSIDGPAERVSGGSRKDGGSGL
jgi:hypothetical protein